MPFTPEQFLGVFAAYNEAIWPAQLFLYSAGIAVAILAYRGRAAARRPIALLLALLWGWMGGVYHLGFFRVINPAALVFGIAFLVQAVLFLGWGLGTPSVGSGKIAGARAWLGGAVIGYALFVYPLIGWLLGHRYPASPTFGLPCPTTILTLGLFVWIRPAVPWWLLVVPLGWAAVGTAAALLLGIREDIGLVVAAGVTASIWLRQKRVITTTSTSMITGKGAIHETAHHH